MSIFRFLFPVLLLFSSLYSRAESDSLFVPGIRLGLDISGALRYALEPELIMAEASIDYEFRPHWFAALEGGMLRSNIQGEQFAYEASGQFLRLGVDYNLLKRAGSEQGDLVVLSIRYGLARLDHQAPYLVIHDPIWGDYSSSLPMASHGAHWLEIGGGLRTRIWQNLMIGWNIRARIMLSQRQDMEMDPWAIAGYGKNTGPFRVMLHYSLYYQIPLSF